MPTTLARFTASRDRPATFATGTLQPPTSVTGSAGAGVSLSWTASTSVAAAGYQLLRSATSGTGYAQVSTVTPASATTATDMPGTGTWYYVLRTYLQGWTSANSNEAAVALGGAPTSTGYKDCSSNAADTGGDGNGFETRPENGCVEDGTYARDANSGTGTSNACSSSDNDRHRFWGYDFGLPGSVSSIDGITVQARMRTGNANGTYGACIQLSWDGGTSWTANEPITFSTRSVTTYTFGSASDTWGHTWTPADLAAGMFRVRITNVTTVANKRFDLDHLGVAVDYTP